MPFTGSNEEFEEKCVSDAKDASVTVFKIFMSLILLYKLFCQHSIILTGNPTV